MCFVVYRGGRTQRVTQAPALLPPRQSAQVLCNRSYDADMWRERLLATDHQPVAHGRHDLLVQPDYDEYFYPSRHLIQNAIARLKSARRNATSYEEKVIAYMAFVSLDCVCHWLV